MTKRSDDVSPIFSLADTFVHTVNKVDTFEDLGSAHDGHHVGLFFRKLVETQVSIDYQSPYSLNRFCKMYNFVNSRGSIYGHLFVVSNPSKMILTQHRMVLLCGKNDVRGFAQLPITSHKQKLLFCKTAAGSVVVLSGHSASKYLVTEPT